MIEQVQLATISSELNKSNLFLDSLVENIPLMIFVKDAQDLRFVRFNRAGEKLLGIPREELIGKNDYDFFPAAQANLFIEKDRAVLSGREIVDIPEERIMTRALGERILHTKKIPLFDSEGRVQFLLGISEDITERKQAEETRLLLIREEATFKERESSERDAAFLSAASAALASTLNYHESLERLGTLIVNNLCDWCTISVQKNKGEFERVALCHRDPSYLPLLEDLKKVHPLPVSQDSRLNQLLSVGRSMLLSPADPKILRQESAGDEHFEAMSKIGVAHFLAVPMRVRDKILGVILLFSSDPAKGFSLADQQFAEEIGYRAGIAIENAFLFEEAQKAIQARDEFLSIASHELKTPITSLKLQLQLTKRSVQAGQGEMPSPERFQRFLNVSMAQIDRLTRLVEDLLDVARIQAGKISFEFESADLSLLVQDVVERYQEPLLAAHCALSLRVEDGLMARVDRGRIEQVIVNLISNVIKYAPGMPVEIRLSRKQDWAILEVEDKGPGIKPDRLPRVFERFERAVSGRNISGLGLGLFITQRIVQNHGGKVAVESDFGRGTLFTVSLPLLP